MKNINILTVLLSVVVGWLTPVLFSSLFSGFITIYLLLYIYSCILMFRFDRVTNQKDSFAIILIAFFLWIPYMMVYTIFSNEDEAKFARKSIREDFQKLLGGYIIKFHSPISFSKPETEK